MDFGYEVPEGSKVDAKELVSTMLVNIQRLVRESEERTSTTLDALHARALRGEAGLEAPHPDARWRFRSRRVFERAREQKMVESMPWHHREIWFWAASCEAGVDWAESEIRYWEKHIDGHIRRVDRLKKQKRDLPQFEYVYQDGDELRFWSDDENLKEKVDGLWTGE